MTVTILRAFRTAPPPIRDRRLIAERTVVHFTDAQLARLVQDLGDLTDADEIDGEDVDECLGHPIGPFDRLGETIYCDGSCRP